MIVGKLSSYFSNRVEHLYENLSQQLFNQTTTPFTQRVIIVPSPEMKRWLTQRLAKDPKIGIAAGISFPGLSPALESLCKDIFEVDFPSFPSQLELSLRLEAEISTLILRAHRMPESEKDLFKPLFAFLKVNGDAAAYLRSRKGEKRLILFCAELAKLFVNYGQFAEELVDGWEQHRGDAGDDGWQAALWRKIFVEKPIGSYPLRFVKEILAKRGKCADIQVHLFGLSYISKWQGKLLCHLAKTAAISIHFLSPCRAFWSDLRSDAESLFLQQIWKRRGASLSERMALEDYLRDTNSLLANWGKLGREYVSLLEELDLPFEDFYELPAGILHQPAYEENLDDQLHFRPQKSDQLTLLEAVQADILLLRNPKGSPPILFAHEDRSIQVHEAASKMREVEILHDRLMALIDKHKDDASPICPSDILVMAPRISDYFPFIQTVFQCREKTLPIMLTNLQLSSQKEMAQGVKKLTELAKGRWTSSSVLALFENGAFLRKQELSLEDLEQIKNWIKLINIKWGEDLDHCNELLKRDYEGQQFNQTDSVTTWEYGIGELLGELTSKGHFGNQERLIDFSKAELLGKWWHLMRSLREDLKLLVDGSKLALSEWASYLECLLKAYFAPGNERDAKDEELFLGQQFGMLRRFDYKIKLETGQALYSFASIASYIEDLLSQETISFNEKHLQAVHFCSLLPMRAIPARIVCLLGMNEEAYPRKEPPCFFDARKKEGRIDYCPLRSDWDRYLFLESLLSARDYFLITYKASSEGEKEGTPSLLVTELLSYLDKSFLLEGGGKPSLHCCYKHFAYPFHHAYFNSEKKCIQSYSKKQYALSQARYLPDRQAPHYFVPQFFVGVDQPSSMPANPIDCTIDIKHLVDLISRPLKIYFNQTLRTYLPFKEQVDLDEESFVLHSRDLHQIKKGYLHSSLIDLVAQAEKLGKLPLGAFKTVAQRRIASETEEIQSQLINLGVNKEDFFTLEFNERCRKTVKLSSGQWVVPALKIPYRSFQIKITGSLSEVCAKGLFVLRKDVFKDKIKEWPKFLLLGCAPQECHELMERNLLLGVDGKAIPACKEPLSLWEPLLDYYFACASKPCPLLPEWLEAAFEGNDKRLQKQIESSFSEFKGSAYEDYLLWTVASKELPNAQMILKNWHEPLQAFLKPCQQMLKGGKNALL